MFQASCLCQSVRIEADELVGPYVYCHCKSCRKSSGSAFAANVSVPVESFRVSSGKESLKTYESTPGKVRHFCSCCGSPMFTKVGDSPKYVRLRLGSLDSNYPEQTSAHIFVGHKASWHQIHDRQRQYTEWPDASEIRIPGSRQHDSRSTDTP